MQILNTFVAKQGPAGKRNRAARRKQERIAAFHNARQPRGTHFIPTNALNEMLNNIQNHRKTHLLEIDDVVAEDFGLTGTKLGVIPASVFEPKEEPKVDFSGVWDHTVAQLALKAFEASGKSQKAFAAEHNFPVGRISSWKKKLGIFE